MLFESRGGRPQTEWWSRLDGLFLEDELDEGGVEVVSDVLVLLLLGNQLVCTFAF